MRHDVPDRMAVTIFVIGYFSDVKRLFWRQSHDAKAVKLFLTSRSYGMLDRKMTNEVYSGG
ncbi:MAG: hypothetical protein ACTXOO_03230 [Sodalis sp. (in: enterobacteria)]